MDYQDLMRDLSRETPSRIVMLVMDGLGGLAREPGGKTELETANTPNLDALAAKSICGLLDPIAPGVTPGSGPGHLALFGYDPIRWNMGRGVLEACGINFPLKHGDIAIRINFCTVDDQGIITDRRAGRISTDKCKELAAVLDKIKVPGVECMCRPVKDHRAVVVFRGEGLGDALKDTDPQVIGKPPIPLAPRDPPSAKTAGFVNQWLEQAKKALAAHHPANMLLLRGFASYAPYPTFAEVYKLKAAAIAQYPMYRGLAQIVGMDILDSGTELPDLMTTLEKAWDQYTFFFVHVKKTDSAGEDGDFDRKVKVIEGADALLPRLMALKPDVVIVSGDHSTPAILKGHSWHPLPALIFSNCCRPDNVVQFSEQACIAGGLGRMPTVSLMPLALANALKLDKFGA